MLPTVCHATEGGFFGFLRTIPAGVRMLILEGGQVSDNFADILNRQRMGKVVDSSTCRHIRWGQNEWPWQVGSKSILLPENHTYMDTESYLSMGSTSRVVSSRKATQVMNPIACLHLEDILLFTVTRHHYPQYDMWVRKFLSAPFSPFSYSLSDLNWEFVLLQRQLIQH